MPDVRVEGPAVERGEEILTPEALAFVADLQTRLLDDARALFEQVALADEFQEILTLPAYGLIVEGPRPPQPSQARVGPLDGAAS